MPIDITTEQIVSLTEATKILPKVNGKRPAISTLWRWCRKGLGGVQLEYIRMGRNIATSQEALNRFFIALAEADETPACLGADTPRSRPEREPTPAERQREREETHRFLVEAGIRRPNSDAMVPSRQELCHRPAGTAANIF